jgi:hypothetical protein
LRTRWCRRSASASASRSASLEQDRVVVVVVGQEAFDVRLDADARGDGERTDPVLSAAVLWRDEVRQAEIGAFDRFVDLLSQEVQGGGAIASFEHHVVADAVCQPQPEHRLRGQPLFRQDAIEHPARIAE